jgi:hypothetical protein
MMLANYAVFERLGYMKILFLNYVPFLEPFLEFIVSSKKN